jgi:hypothetical protein
MRDGVMMAKKPKRAKLRFEIPKHDTSINWVRGSDYSLKGYIVLA